MTKPIWMWALFIGLIFLLLALDLGVFNRKNHVIEVKESLLFSAFYITIGLLFGGWIWFQLSPDAAITYWTGFVVEKTLAMDNIFVIAMIFTYFNIPRQYQHRVLFWGILGVIVLRGIMIGVGAALIHEFEWILLIFAAFLVFTGIKMLVKKDSDDDASLSDSKLLTFMRKHLRITDGLREDRFFIKEAHKKSGKIVLFVTPLFVTLVMIEFADVIFAVDSIPAIFAITTDPYLVFTSNIFAILGLRALYFALSAMLNYFTYLQQTLAIVLIFIGGKIVVTELLDNGAFPPMLSLAITVALLTGGVLLSLWKKPRAPQADGE